MVDREKRTSGMRIGIDARLIDEKGLGRYIKNLLGQLQTLDHENEYLIFLLKKDYDRYQFSQNFHKIIADFRWYTVREQTEFPKILNKLNLDLLHVPHFNIPIFYRGRMIVTIHDLIHQHVDTAQSSTHNVLVYQLKKIAYKKVFKTAITKSKKVITVSNFVKKQLEDEWGVSASKIVVTSESVDEIFLKSLRDLTAQKTKNILEQYGIKQPFIFYVGNAHPHKNIDGLIQAFLILKEHSDDLQLVLAGDDSHFWPRLKNKFKQKDIIYTGRVSDETLAVFYKNARCFVTASFEEGFGLPVLEAFSADCPVVSSNQGSLPEIGGDAAVYFDPLDTKEIVEKITKVLDDSSLRRDLIEKGRKRVKQFSWEKMAKETLEVYQSAS